MTSPHHKSAAWHGLRPVQAVFGVLVAVLSISIAGISFALAQEGQEGGPTPEEIAQFEREFQPADVAQGPDEMQIEKPEFEEPGQIPDEVKKLVKDSDLVAVYCAMTKWKSGKFFAAMDAMENVVIPAMEPVKALGITLDMPDPAAYKAEGQRRIEAICAAKDSAEADRLVRDFLAWGQSDAFAKFAGSRDSLRAKIEEVAAKMRAEIKVELDPFIEEQKTKISAEIDAAAHDLAKTKSARFASYKKPPSAAEIAALKAEITSELQGLISQKKAEVDAAVKAKVNELIGDKGKNLTTATAGLKGLEKKVNDYIAANASKYDTYKEEAISLRKKMVLGLLDSSMDEGLKELDARAAEIDQAHKENPDVPSVEEVRSQIAADRKALEGKLDAALQSGDETAFQNALNDFRLRWENYRVEMEQAAKQSAAKVCTVALAQFDNAKKQMAPGKARIEELLNRCGADTSEECLRVNEFSERLGTLSGKLDDLALEMAAAEKMCSAPETADRNNLLALMRKIQIDGEELKTYGEALDAEKTQAMAAGVEDICNRALPQLKAAEVEIADNDLAQLKSQIAGCKETKDGMCAMVVEVAPTTNKLAGRVSQFLEDVSDVRAACADPLPDDIERLSTMLEDLKGQGEEMRAEAKELKAEVAAKASASAFCKAVSSTLGMAREEVAHGLAETIRQQNACAGATQDPRCLKIKEMAPRFDALIKRIGGVGGRISEVLQYCEKHSADKIPDPDIIKKAEDIKGEREAIDAEAAAIMAEGEQAAKDAQTKGKAAVWIEAEAEVRTGLLPRTEPWHSIKGGLDAWRPPVFGTGYWYLSRGGEWLEYDLTAPIAGTYSLWIRDLASNVAGQEGQAIVTVAFDKKVLGSFPENVKGRTVAYPKGAFYWHKVGAVQLTAGKHVLRVTKQATTSRAAILDAYYLTTGSDTPAER